MLPSTTEILFALGAGDDVVGVTFECDFPAEARARRIVSTTALPEGLSPAEIDAEVIARVAAGEDLYRLDAGALGDLDADVVVTQDLCAVCAVDVSVVDDALDHLGCTAEVVTVDPMTLDAVFDSIRLLGVVTGTETRASALVESLIERLAAVECAVHDVRRRRVAVLEWTDPLFAAGHWVPDMVTAAGGRNVLGASGERSRRIEPSAVQEAAPDVVVVAPCGYRLDGARALALDLLERRELELPAHAQVWAADADAVFVRPGPRLVDGVEALAAALHPALLPPRPDLVTRVAP